MELPKTFKALVAHGPGQESTIEELPLKKPQKNQVIVKMNFVPINPSDIMITQGFYSVPVNPPYTVGLEGSGTIVEIGEDLKVPHKVGDKVHVAGLGTYGQYLLANSEDLRQIQRNLSIEEAACHFINPVTVGCMAHYVLKKGHKAVIHTAGASALGRMMIRYFKHKGIKLINIVRRDEYIQDLEKEGVDYVLNSEAPDFEEKFRKISEEEQATLAFDAVGGDLTDKILKNMPNGSTVLIYGSLAGGRVGSLGVQDFLFKGKKLSGFWLTPYLTKLQKIGEISQVLDEVYSLLPTVLSSSIQKVFEFEDYKEALDYYSKNSSKGKILLKLN